MKPVPSARELAPWPWRPHHLMCWQTYRGQGYSAAFVTNFDALKAHVRTMPETPVRLTIGSDPICTPCPHRRDDGCETAASVDSRDRALLAGTGLHEGDVLSLDEGLALVKSRFLELQGTVCAGCEWFDGCRTTMSSPA